jgi:hypothetical protein
VRFWVVFSAFSICRTASLSAPLRRAAERGGKTEIDAANRAARAEEIFSIRAFPRGLEGRELRRGQFCRVEQGQSASGVVAMHLAEEAGDEFCERAALCRCFHKQNY